MIVRTFAREDIASQAAGELETIAQQAIEARGHFNLVLTGGGLGIELVSKLQEQAVSWAKTNLIFSDERFVQMESADRNEFQALDAWSGLFDSNWIRYPNPNQKIASAASEMNKTLNKIFGPVAQKDPVFDLVVLGMGPDGHVASLFPGRTHADDWVVSEENSPKPPAERLSLSYRALNRSRRLWFLVAGSEKADAVRNAMKSFDLPAGKVKGAEETVWWLDQELSDAL